MTNQESKDQASAQADNNSIAIGRIEIGGDVSGTITIGNTGYTVEEVSVLITQITATFQPKPFDGRPPYKGLDVFEEEDSELFFGREKLMDDLVSRVKDSRTVFVTGPSGSGKSSLVRAGLIHALKQGAIKGSERWLYATMKPGRDPIESLANAFSRLKSPELGNYFRQHVDQVKVLHECAESALTDNKNQRLVLFIDQFEEVFTQISKEEERVAFLNLLTHAATIENGRVIILFSMRSDFVSNCATYPQLNALLNQQFVQIGAMQPEELVSAIAQPALRVGLRIDPDLIVQIINEMKGEPGALPLMQFALKDLFDSQQEKNGIIALTLNDYLQRGGIHKALERHADDSFSKLSKHEQELARSIFSGLIEIGRGTHDTGRTALFNELVPADAEITDVHGVVQKLADARLITTDEQAGKNIVSLSHEKLIDAWPWLRKLVDKNRDAIALQNVIATDAKEWDDHKKEASYLYTGTRLANVREQLVAQKLVLSGLSHEFINEGHVKQRRRQVTQTSGIFIVMSLIILGITLYFYQSTANSRNLLNQSAAFASTQAASANTSQAIAVTAQFNEKAAKSAEATAVANQIRADQNAEEAKTQTLYAISDKLSSLALSSFDTDYTQSLLFGVESYRLLKTHDLDSGRYPDTLPALLQKTESGFVLSLTSPPSGTVWKITYSLDGELMAVISNSVDVWDTTDPLSPKFIKSLSVSPDVQASDVAFDPSSSLLAIGYVDGRVSLYDVEGFKEIGNITDYQSDTLTTVKVSFNRDGTILALSASNQISLWDLTTPNPSRVDNFPKNPHNYKNITNLFFLPAYQNFLVSMGEDNFIRIWDIQNPKDPKQIGESSGDSGIISMTISNYQPYGIVLASNRYLYFYDSKFALIGEFDYSNDQSEPIRTMVFNPTKQQLFTASSDGTIAVWDMSKVWVPSNLSTEVSLIRKYAGHASLVKSIAFHPKENMFSSGGYDSKIILWNIAEDSSPSIWQNYITDRNAVTDVVYNSIADIAYSPTHNLLAVGYNDGNIQLWDVANSAKKSLFHLIPLPVPVLRLGFNSSENFLVIQGAKSGQYQSNMVIKDILNIETTPYSLFSFTEEINFFAFNNKYNLVGLNTIDNNIAIYPYDISLVKPRKGSQLGTTNCPSRDVATSQDGDLIAIASCSVQLWDFSDNKIPSMVDEESALNPQAMAFSWDGKMLASGNGDNSIALWGVSGNKLVLVTEIKNAQQKPITGIAFSPDGKLLASGGEDQAVVLWDISNPKNPVKRFILKGHSNKILNGGIFITGDGKTIISASKSEVILWDIDPQSWLEKACNIAGRNLTKLEWKQLLGNEPYHLTCPQLPEGQ